MLARTSTLFTNVLKYLTMKFTSIPSNGADWNKTLLYTIETDESDSESVAVDIIDVNTRQSIGSFTIYTSATKSFDIAPYLRSQASIDPVVQQSGIAISPSAFNVRVVANGVESLPRIYYRAPIDYTISTILSDAVESDEVSVGDVFKLTIFAVKRVMVKVTRYWLSPKVYEYSIDTQCKPVEFSYLFNSTTAQDRFTIEVFCDSVLMKSYSRSYVQSAGTQTLLWYNPRGGIETYSFPKQTRLCCRAEIENLQDGMGAYTRLSGATTRSVLCSAYESEERIKHLAEIILSPRVYTWRDGECQEVRLAKREIEFNNRGHLLSLDIEIEEKWKGGRLW